MAEILYGFYLVYYKTVCNYLIYCKILFACSVLQNRFGNLGDVPKST